MSIVSTDPLFDGKPAGGLGTGTLVRDRGKVNEV